MPDSLEGNLEGDERFLDFFLEKLPKLFPAKDGFYTIVGENELAGEPLRFYRNFDRAYDATVDKYFQCPVGIFRICEGYLRQGKDYCEEEIDVFFIEAA